MRDIINIVSMNDSHFVLISKDVIVDVNTGNFYMPRRNV